LVAMRDFRWVSQENESLHPTVEETRGTLTLRPYEGLPTLAIHHNAEWVERSPCWYKGFEYLQEEISESTDEKGGKRALEDLWSFGHLRYLLKVGESCALVASTGRRGSAEFTFHTRRMENTQKVLAKHLVAPGKGPLTSRLTWTADSFIARRSLSAFRATQVPGPGETYVLAGFPWFSCWGRDALIALPGLTLVPQRFGLARSILETMGSLVKEGLIPVRLSEEDGTAEYDSADTSLWFVWAVWQYVKFTKDFKFVEKKLLRVLKEILEAYLEGTNFGLRMDEDGMILLSDRELPLTWMDAREPSAKSHVLGRAVTPRFGKAVEINALWYCTLEIMAFFHERFGLKQASTYRRLSRLVEQNFIRTFVTPEGLLYDRVTEETQDTSIRPNMLIAASLPFTPVPRKEALKILTAVERYLLTPVGIRTLSPTHPQYRGQYAGDLKARSQAYHQGTVWTWLIGPYATTVCRLRRLTKATQASLSQQLQPYVVHLSDGGLGSISEIFDGEAPHTPRGGISQAWSVGEVLRVLHEARLGDL